MKRWRWAAFWLLVMVALLANAEVHAQTLRITNEAGGIACYDSSDLMTAHTALGYFNQRTVQILIAQDKCFVLGKHWQPTITDEVVIRGVDVKMVEVRLDRFGVTRRAWSLLKNFDFIGD